MKIKAAMTILNKECEFLGMTIDDLIEAIEMNKESYPLKTLEAYSVFTEERV